VRNCGLWSDGRDDDGFVWALRIRTGNREWLAEARRHNDLLSRTVPLAVELWHEPCVSLRDGNELLCICGRCSALGYGDAAEGVVGGALARGRVPERGAAGDHRPHGQARRKVALAERALSSPLAQACRGDGPDT
jgi:hypothetical protein